MLHSAVVQPEPNKPPWSRTQPYQLNVQQSSSRHLDRRAHISPALQQLHWLPVKHRVTFKIATLTNQVLQKRCPSNLANPLVPFNTTDSQRRQIRSSTTRSAAVRRARTQFGKCAFSVSGPGVWNSLPTPLRNIDSYPAFRRASKSHLLSCASPHNCYPITFTDIVMHSRPCYCSLGTRTFIASRM